MKLSVLYNKLCTSLGGKFSQLKDFFKDVLCTGRSNEQRIKEKESSLWTIITFKPNFKIKDMSDTGYILYKR